QLTALRSGNFYKNPHTRTTEFVEAVQRYATAKNYRFKVFQIGSIFWFAFTDKETITAAADIDHGSMEYYKAFHRELLNRGVYLGPSGYEVSFVSAAHTKVELEKTKRAIFESLDEVFRAMGAPKS